MQRADITLNQLRQIAFLSLSQIDLTLISSSKSVVEINVNTYLCCFKDLLLYSFIFAILYRTDIGNVYIEMKETDLANLISISN